MLFSKPQDKMYPQLLGSKRDISPCTEFMVILVEIWLKTCFWSVWMLQNKTDVFWLFCSGFLFPVWLFDINVKSCVTYKSRSVWFRESDTRNWLKAEKWCAVCKCTENISTWCLCVTRCQGEEEYTTNQITLVHQPRNALYLGHFFFFFGCSKPF